MHQLDSGCGRIGPHQPVMWPHETCVIVDGFIKLDLQTPCMLYTLKHTTSFQCRSTVHCHKSRVQYLFHSHMNVLWESHSRSDGECYVCGGYAHERRIVFNLVYILKMYKPDRHYITKMTFWLLGTNWKQWASGCGSVLYESLRAHMIYAQYVPRLHNRYHQ